jgi:hypothetical protein
VIKKVIEEITDKMGKLALSSSIIGEAGSPMICLEDGFLPKVDSNPCA